MIFPVASFKTRFASLLVVMALSLFSVSAWAADGDGDGVDDTIDNCPAASNAAQTNTDGAADGGDVCDTDDDNDGVADGSDNCPLSFGLSANQTNTDGAADGGDVCDPDDDNDGVADGSDNCPLVSNASQTNTDGAADGGDACDTDNDNDTLLDTAETGPCSAPYGPSTCSIKDDTDGDGDKDNVDNCPVKWNPLQRDKNNDGIGDACQDTDGDTLIDEVETGDCATPNVGSYVSTSDTGTCYTDVDTDGDTLNDNIETSTGNWVSAANPGTSPLLADTDGDGLNDKVETNSGTFVSATNTGTHPLEPDTDEDRLNDGQEVNTVLTNPLIRDTDADGLKVSVSTIANISKTATIDINTPGDNVTIANVAISIANPAVLTWTRHGLVAGNRIRLATTGSLPTGLQAGAEYYVRSVLTADTFTISTSPTGAAVVSSGSQSGNHSASATTGVKLGTATISVADPAVVSWTAHGLLAGDDITLDTTGQLPGGLAAGIDYIVKDVIDADSFTVALPGGGAALATTGTQSGTHTVIAPVASTKISSPAVVSWPAHGLIVGNELRFTTNGILPVGVEANTNYFVNEVIDANTLTISATAGGAVLQVNGFQSGAHSAATTGALITATAHGLVLNDAVRFTTTGALPTGLTVGATYFVTAVPSVNTFTVSDAINGEPINTQGTQSGTHTVKSMGQVDTFAISAAGQGYAVGQQVELALDQVATPTKASVTVSSASPGVITWNSHDLSVGNALRFSVTPPTGSLPGGIFDTNAYFVKTVLSANTFTVAASPGGAAVNTTSTGSGVEATELPSTTVSFLVTTVDGSGGVTGLSLYASGRHLSSGSVLLDDDKQDNNDAFPLNPAEAYDTDSDGTGDNADTDDDGDTLADTVETNTGVWVSASDTGTHPLKADTDLDQYRDDSDKCPHLKQTGYPAAQVDTDNDGLGNDCDNDDDNDSLTDSQEVALGTNALVADSDGDSDADNVDNCPLASNASQLDTDSDGKGNACDDDMDGDGIANAFELTGGANPADPLLVSDPLLKDTDGDLLNDGADNCRSVANANQVNMDNDIYGDACDLDIDGDGLDHNAELARLTDEYKFDTDNDGVWDAVDNCPITANGSQADMNSNGQGDVCDNDVDGDGLQNVAEEASGTDPFDPDTDDDSVNDQLDPFPTNDQEWLDTDNDGIGNNEDDDDDGDGLLDTAETDTGIWLSQFNTGTDPLDTDSDGDGFVDGSINPVDVIDNCPAVVNANQLNTDGDSRGDVCDPDDDNDQLVDTAEPGYGTNPLDADTDNDGLNDGLEIKSGYNPLVAGPEGTLDFDNDGLNNGAEQTPGTDLQNPDTDFDGLNDAWEVTHGHAPLAADYKLAAGAQHGCVLDDDGVHCWGYNGNGQTTVPALANPTQITAGGAHSCAIDDSGVRCWGSNATGQSDVPGVSNPSVLSVGGRHACALDAGGVTCWGGNTYGEKNVPALVNPQQLATGEVHSCALDDAGVHCWGAGSAPVASPAISPHYGQSIVPALTHPVQIKAGKYQTCALDDYGVHCWGSTASVAKSPVSISMGNAAVVTWAAHGRVANDHVMFSTSGTLPAGLASGVTYYIKEVLSADTFTLSYTPGGAAINTSGSQSGSHNLTVTEPALQNPVAMAVGDSHTCALDANGVQCWGSNGSGQSTVPTLDAVTQITAGANHSCALDSTGVHCWGSSANGKTTVPTLVNPVKVLASGNHTCALDDTGVHCWGANTRGETTVPPLALPTDFATGSQNTCAATDTGVKCWGSNSYKQNDVPGLVQPSMVSAGSSHTCALDAKGVHCWGYNNVGQTDVPVLVNPIAVTAGGSHSCALDEFGVQCWGDNALGQATVPVLDNPRMVSAGAFHTCALDDTGVHCWGSNTSGQITVPPTLNKPQLISAGYGHTCALDSTGVHCWGANGFGQSTVPTLDKPATVAAGRYFSCALSMDAAGVHCWGSASNGMTTVPALRFDPDGDGLTNPQEIALGTDRFDEDSDDDNLRDGFEVDSSLTDPFIKDTDGDGLDDDVEVNTTHSDPLIADTDNDGLSDGEEANNVLTDPLLTDTDSDGLEDGDEVNNYSTDPLLADTDGDGWRDDYEVLEALTDPTVGDTDVDTYADNVDAFPLDVTQHLDIDDDNIPDELGLDQFPGDALSLRLQSGQMKKDWQGASVGAGDVDNDGYDDVVVGVPQFDVLGSKRLSNAGQVRVYSGRSGALLHTFNGTAANERLGGAVAGAGDVNNDGYADVIAGAYKNAAGIARVYSGATGSVLYTLSGQAQGDGFGWSVASAGDTDNNGTDDVIVGAKRGYANVYSGADGSLLHHLTGSSAGDGFGLSVSGAGDIDNDSNADVIVGAYKKGYATVYSGADGGVLHTFTGNSGDAFGWSVSSAGDADNDGTADVIVGAPKHDVPNPIPGGKPALLVDAGQAVVYSGADGSVLRTLDGGHKGDTFGFAVSGGDIDADGYSDVLVGAPQYDLPYTNSKGKPALLANVGAVYAYSGADGSVLYTGEGTQKSARYGHTVCALGDVNGDGYADLMAGQPLFDAAGPIVDAGAVTVLSGKNATGN